MKENDCKHKIKLDNGLCVCGKYMTLKSKKNFVHCPFSKLDAAKQCMYYERKDDEQKI